MDRNAIWKWLILIVLIVGSLSVLSRGITLGLDLQGGISFVVKIDEDQIREDVSSRPGNPTPKEVKDEISRILDGAQKRTIEVMRNRLHNMGIEEPIILGGKDNRIIITLPGVD